MNTAQIILVLGGTRSGKSRRAESLAAGADRAVTYVACCLTSGLDDEMRARIAAHRTRRPPHWRTVEDRLDLARLAAEETEGAAPRLLLIDSLALWVSGRIAQGATAADLDRELDLFTAETRARACAVIVVSDELGLGPVPADAGTRRFRDQVGLINQRFARVADRVELVVAGCTLVLKGES